MEAGVRGGKKGGGSDAKTSLADVLINVKKIVVILAIRSKIS